MNTDPVPGTAEDYVRFHLREHWPWLLVGAGLLLLAVMLGPILMPFVVGAGLAYVGDPIVDRLQRLRLSRTAAVCVVFTALTLAGLAALLLLAPMVYHQFLALLRNIPDWLVWLQTQALPRLGVALPAGVQLDAEGLKAIVTQHWSEAGGFVQAAWERVSQSGKLLLITVANLLLIPVVSFYLLRDWDDLIAWIRGVIPPRYLPKVGELAGEADGVLGAFIRGQLSVMAALALYYAVALWAAGLDLALVVGLIVGLISFIPYLGSIVGVLIAVIAMLVQTQDPTSLIWIAVVFGIGQFLEGNVLTPWLVGDRIGLHPVAVIFAVMAGGQLFGFVGVLLALPVAAVLAVMMRHTKRQWLLSPLYRAGTPQSLPAAPAQPPASDEPTSPLP
ncbi:AI-2E family transporter [Solimonas fluminis]|uniref:AI-2E family transporter n=1 Tax=Solimonas fluminis TaxID=2086571 RepID=A0A2S5TEU8_9GAMM|nr:AI-2E family transporter [Solimonas fluminis]PPE73499.1 AI-2E family transporter [Solimonas fluminis]